MKAVGVVRKMDQLGRIVVPKPLRKLYRLNEGEPVEISVQGDYICLERYRPRCVFCGSADEVIELKGRQLCKSCIRELALMKSKHNG